MTLFKGYLDKQKISYIINELASVSLGRSETRPGDKAKLVGGGVSTLLRNQTSVALDLGRSRVRISS